MSTRPVFFLKMKPRSAERWGSHFALWQLDAAGVLALIEQEGEEEGERQEIPAGRLRVYPREVEWEEETPEEVRLWLERNHVVFSRVTSDFDWPEWPPLRTPELAVQSPAVVRHQGVRRMGWGQGRLWLEARQGHDVLESEPLAREVLLDLLSQRMRLSSSDELVRLFPALARASWEHAVAFLWTLPPTTSFAIPAELYARLLSHPDARVRMSLIARPGLHAGEAAVREGHTR